MCGQDKAPHYLPEALRTDASVTSEVMNGSPENEKLQLPAEMEDLHSAVTAINYARVRSSPRA